MIYKTLFIIAYIIVFISAFVITHKILADIITRTIGTPECRPFNDGSGTRCFDLVCKFSSGDSPVNYDECETSNGQGWEQPRAIYGVTLCAYAPCNRPTDVLTCETSPPAESNVISYSFQGCEPNPIPQSVIKELRCPIKCKRCDTPPNSLGVCPTGYYKSGKCCWRNDVGRCLRPETCFDVNGNPVCCPSPIIIDILGNGFNLTNAADGVRFDISAEGFTKQVAWTAVDSDDVWLALDRNNNGLIDSGAELFGNHTPQPQPPAGEKENGFLALAVYDKTESGGNNDGQIDARDAVFSSLKLWQDQNHNGISESNELQNLSASPMRVIELDYHETRRQDEHGNWFRYRAKVKDAHGAQVGRWAWDVFLKVQR